MPHDGHWPRNPKSMPWHTRVPIAKSAGQPGWTRWCDFSIITPTFGGTMSATPPHDPLQGIFQRQAHERIIFGPPAEEAVLAEADRYGAKRVFVTSTRSLARKRTGRCSAGEGAWRPACRHLLRHQARTARARTWWPAPTLRARPRPTCWSRSGGGSVIDATKAMLLCLWMGARHPRGDGALLLGLRPHQDAAADTAGRSDPHDLGLDHAVGLRVHGERRHHAIGAPTPSNRSAIACSRRAR